MARRKAAGRVRCAATLAAIGLLGASCSSPEGPEAIGAAPDEALGMRVGGGLFDLEAFEEVESELGRPLRFTVQFTGRQSQKDMNGSAFGLLAAERADLPTVADRIDLSITVPLGFGTAKARSPEGRAEIAGNLQAVIDGAHDDAYRRVGRRLVEAGFTDAIIRLGHEFNGAWSPWSSRSNEELYVEAFRHVHDLLREQSTEFRFDWTAMRVGWDEFGPPAYPGDDYVDVLGMDIYWRTLEIGEWSDEAWRNNFLSVLESHLRFAVERGKPVSYPEWGVVGDESPNFVTAMHNWMASLPEEGPGRLVYHSYFNTNGEFSLDNLPETQQTFYQLFGAA